MKSTVSSPRSRLRPSALLRRLACQMACLVACLVAGTAQAQFAMVPTPLVAAAPRDSAAEIEKEYRIDAAKHLYAS